MWDREKGGRRALTGPAETIQLPWWCTEHHGALLGPLSCRPPGGEQPCDVPHLSSRGSPAGEVEPRARGLEGGGWGAQPADAGLEEGMGTYLGRAGSGPPSSLRGTLLSSLRP